MEWPVRQPAVPSCGLQPSFSSPRYLSSPSWTFQVFFISPKKKLTKLEKSVKRGSSRWFLLWLFREKKKKRNGECVCYNSRTLCSALYIYRILMISSSSSSSSSWGTCLLKDPSLSFSISLFLLLSTVFCNCFHFDSRIEVIAGPFHWSRF